MIKYNNNSINDWYFDTSDIVKVYRNNAVRYQKIYVEPTATPKWIATYQGGVTSSAECDSTSAITENEIKRRNLTDVVIGDCVTSIGTSAFEKYSSLTSILIPNSVTIIGGLVFNNCSSLTSVTIPDSVTSIGQNAFNACSGLRSVTIGNSVTNIGASAFNYCSSLTSITVEAPTPPILENSFVFGNTNNCPIYVPAASVETYKSANRWRRLASRIQAIQ